MVRRQACPHTLPPVLLCIQWSMWTCSVLVLPLADAPLGLPQRPSLTARRSIASHEHKKPFISVSSSWGALNGAADTALCSLHAWAGASWACLSAVAGTASAGTVALGDVVLRVDHANRQLPYQLRGYKLALHRLKHPPAAGEHDKLRVHWRATGTRE